jgi:hypothetical protein
MKLQSISPVFLALGVVLTAVITGCVGENQAASPPDTDVVITKGGDDRTGPYDVVEGWWKQAPNHDDEWSWGQVAGVAVDNPDRIIVVTRGDWPKDRSRLGKAVRRTNSSSIDGDRTSWSSGPSGTRS